MWCFLCWSIKESRALLGKCSQGSIQEGIDSDSYNKQSTDRLETISYRQTENREEENSNMDSLLVKLGQEVLELIPHWDTNTSWRLWGYQCVTHAHMYIKINETCTFLLLICLMTFMLHVPKGSITPKGVKGIFPSSGGLCIELWHYLSICRHINKIRGAQIDSYIHICIYTHTHMYSPTTTVQFSQQIPGGRTYYYHFHNWGNEKLEYSSKLPSIAIPVQPPCLLPMPPFPH